MSGREMAAADPWSPMRRFTPSRIGTGVVGISQPTAQILRFNADHAVARDAVQIPFDVKAVAAELLRIGLPPAQHVRSLAATRAEYLRRPDLGRLPADASSLPQSAGDIGLVIADGLSARGVELHSIAFIEALLTVLARRYRIATPVIATQARVALGDHIGQALGVTTVLVLIGERPGLSVARSLGVYLTHHPRPGRTDAERNCISNIHDHGGLHYAEAADVCAELIRGARRLGRSGVDLKDTSRGGQITRGTEHLPVSRLASAPESPKGQVAG